MKIIPIYKLYDEFIDYKIKDRQTIPQLCKKVHSWEDFRYLARLVWFALTKIIIKRIKTNETIRGR